MARKSSDVVATLVLGMDNKSAIRGLKETATQSDKLKTQINRDNDESSASFERTAKAGTMLRDTMGSLMGMVGIGGVAFGLKDMVEGGIQLQTEQSKLQGALRDVGLQAGTTGAQLEKMAESMSENGGFSNGQNLSALTQFVRQTRSAAQAQKMLALATNISRATGTDLATTVQTVSKAYNGQARGLQTLLGPMVASKEASVGLSTAHQAEIAKIQEEAAMLSGPAKTAFVQEAELRDHITAQQSEAAALTDKEITGRQVLTLATNQFAGSTSKYSKTTAGEMSNLRNSFSNMTENIGKSLLPVMDRLVGAGAAVAKVMEKNKTEVELAAVGVGAFAAAWGGLKTFQAARKMLGDLTGAMRLFGRSEVVAGEEGSDAAKLTGLSWKTALMGSVLGIALVVIPELIEHWKSVEKAATAVWHGITAGARAMWKLVKDIFNGGIHDIEELLGLRGHSALSWMTPEGLLGHAAKALFSQGGEVRHLAGGGSGFGTDTVPAELTPGEGVVSRQGMSLLGASGLNSLNSGRNPFGATSVNVSPSQVTMNIDGQVLGKAFIKWVSNQAARGTFSLTGGSLVVSNGGLGGVLNDVASPVSGS